MESASASFFFPAIFLVPRVEGERVHPQSGARNRDIKTSLENVRSAFGCTHESTTYALWVDERLSLFHGFEKCRSFQLSNKSKLGKSRSCRHSSASISKEKGVWLNASTQLKAFDRLNQVNANNPRPIKGRLRIGRFIKYAYGNDAARKIWKLA